jgi:trans-AT polyketide synthase/acyltransferase/oxidoreductase domain-containing protein
MFSGQGSHYYHMGGRLFGSNAIFRKQMYELDEVAKPLLGRSVVEELYDPKHKLADPFLCLSFTHPAIFMTGFALTKVLEHEGIVADCALGFSLGEFTAAALSGILTAEDALRLVIRQARLIEDHCGAGGLVAVLAKAEAVCSIPEVRDNSSIAALNGPEQFVLAGDRRQVHRVKATLDQMDIVHQELMVSYGFHSPAIDPAGPSCRSSLEAQTFRPATLPLISGMSGDLLPVLPENYLWDAIRRPMSFGKAIQGVEREMGIKEELAFLDLGASGTLANLIKYSATENVSRAFQIMTPFRQEERKLEELKKYQSERPTLIPDPPRIKNKPLCAYIFPGQGSQKRGMGAGLFDTYPELTARASELLGYSIKDLCLNDPRRELNRTEFTQPALYVVNALSYLSIGEETGVIPDFLAGHSLGEYNALFAAGAMDFETGLRLVRQRGALMAKMKEGGMAAVKGLSAGEIRQIIERHHLTGIEMANYNTHRQIVLSGPKDLINGAGSHFEAAGATLYFPLNVSGAFHSAYMLPAKEAFENFLRPMEFSSLKIPVVSNVTASCYAASSIRHLLAEQLVKPVQWLDSILFLMGQGEITFKEVGPGDVLTKMVWGIQKDMAEVAQ